MRYIKKQLKDLFKFLGLMDGNGELSRTNILMYAFIYKFMSSPMDSAGMYEIAMAVISSGVYVSKKVIDKKATAKQLPSIDSVTDDRVLD